MSRLISRFENPNQTTVKPLEGRGGLAGGGGRRTGDPKNEGKVYLDLLVKMIPGEVVTLYTFAIKLVPLIIAPRGAPAAADAAGATAAAPSGLQIAVAWGLLIVATALTPWVLSLQEPKPADAKWISTWRWRLGLATGAFLFWAYAISGEQLYPIPFLPALSLVLAGVYAVIAGVVAKAVAPK